MSAQVKKPAYLLLALVFIALAVLSGCKPDPPPPDTPPPPPSSLPPTIPPPTQEPPIFVFQEGNDLPQTALVTRPSDQLVPDVRIGAGFYSSNMRNDLPNLDSLLLAFLDFGVNRLDTSLFEIEDPIHWDGSEYDIHQGYDQFITELNDHGMTVNYMLHFWDKDGRANGEELSTPRFKSEEQVQEFLDYVRFVVGHFEGRIQYYTLWSEPGNCGGSGIKCIEADDYINLARLAIPVIHQADPEAKVALAPFVLYFDREYLDTVLTSDVIAMFDVIQWHGIYDVAPDNEFFGDYYYEYPAIIEGIKQTAAANGFTGEYWGTELTWCSEEYPTCHPADQPWDIQETDKLAAKYYARGIVVQLGMDIGVGFGGLESVDAPYTYPTIRNLNNVMAGAQPISFAVEVENEPPDTLTYIFALPDGDILYALWTNGVAVEDDPGASVTLTFPRLSSQTVVGIDVLHGFEQELITEIVNGNLVVPGLLIKDYPIIIRLSE